MVTLAFFAASLVFSSSIPRPEVVHGPVYCQAVHENLRPAWALDDVEGQLDLSVPGSETLQLRAEFLHFRCVFQGGVWTSTYRTLFPDRAVVFSGFEGHKERRLFFAPIQSLSPVGPHAVEVLLELKRILKKSDLQKLKAGQVVETRMNLRLGHPPKCHPDEKWTPRLEKYWLSWGVLKMKMTLDPSAATVRLEELL